MDAAAAVPDKKLVGKAQNPGRYPYIPTAARQNIATATIIRSRTATAASKPILAIIIDTAVCHLRSPVRSDDHPITRIAIRPTQYGRADMSPTTKSVESEPFLMMAGRKKLKP